MRAFKYRETSLITDIYCEQLGLRSFIVPGVRKSKSKMGAGLFQPMQILELVAFDNPNTSLNRLKEVSVKKLLLDLPLHMQKSAVGIFLIELARKSIKEPEPHPELYKFLEESLLFIDRTKDPVTLLPLSLALKMTQFLGFAPQNPDNDAAPYYFDLNNGVPTTERPGHPNMLHHPLSALFVELYQTPLGELGKLSIPKSDRSALLDKTIQYFKLHIDNMGDLKSPQIFKTLL